MNEQQSVHPYQGGYTRPDRADDYQPVKPVAAAPTGLSGSALEQAEVTMTAAVDAHSRYLQGLQADKHRYSESGYAEQAALFGETAAAKAVDTALARVQATADKAQADVDEMRAGFVQPGDAATESRAIRAWNRFRSQLEAVDGGARFAEAERLLKTANRAELEVLVEELPAWLHANLGAPGDNLKQSLGLGREVTWGDWIDSVHLPRVVPEYKAARDRLANAKKAVAVSQHSADSLKRAIAAGVPVGHALPTASKYDPDK